MIKQSNLQSLSRVTVHGYALLVFARLKSLIYFSKRSRTKVSLKP